MNKLNLIHLICVLCAVQYAVASLYKRVASDVTSAVFNCESESIPEKCAVRILPHASMTTTLKFHSTHRCSQFSVYLSNASDYDLYMGLPDFNSFYVIPPGTRADVYFGGYANDTFTITRGEDRRGCPDPFHTATPGIQNIDSFMKPNICEQGPKNGGRGLFCSNDAQFTCPSENKAKAICAFRISGNDVSIMATFENMEIRGRGKASNSSAYLSLGVTSRESTRKLFAHDTTGSDFVIKGGSTYNSFMTMTYSLNWEAMDNLLYIYERTRDQDADQPTDLEETEHFVMSPEAVEGCEIVSDFVFIPPNIDLNASITLSENLPAQNISKCAGMAFSLKGMRSCIAENPSPLIRVVLLVLFVTLLIVAAVIIGLRWRRRKTYNSYSNVQVVLVDNRNCSRQDSLPLKTEK